jgi:hypothetical protein
LRQTLGGHLRVTLNEPKQILDMQYNISQAIQVLEKTPMVLNAQLKGLDDDWLMSNEGDETFSPFDVVGHMLHGEYTDWTARIKRILDDGDTKPFDSFDRFAMYDESKGKTIDQLLVEFELKRKENLQWFQSLELDEADLEKQGMHPALGIVTLRQLLSTWVIHDLTHIAQINRVMAKQLKEEAGPWQAYFRVLTF